MQTTIESLIINTVGSRPAYQLCESIIVLFINFVTFVLNEVWLKNCVVGFIDPRYDFCNSDFSKTTADSLGSQ